MSASIRSHLFSRLKRACCIKFVTSRSVSKRKHTTGDAYVSYRQLIKERSLQGGRSLLIQFEHDHSMKKVLSALQETFGPIKTGFHFRNDDGKTLALVEFNVKEVLKLSSRHRILHSKDFQKCQKLDWSVTSRVVPFIPKVFDIETLHNCKNVSDQIKCLYREKQLSEAMVRLHFFVGSLVLGILKTYSPTRKTVLAYFGSSSCGLAMEGSSDFDMTILSDSFEDSNIVLKPLSKELRRAPQLLRNIYHIPHARVPIIKFEQTHTQMSCDLSYNGLNGVLTAELFYWLQEYEPSFYPLVIAVKVWAKFHKASESGMTFHLTNYMITILVIAYLQQQSILPALKLVYAGTDGLLRTSGESCLLVWKRMELKKPGRLMGALFTTNIDLGELLLGFFKFYAKFSFRDHVIDPYHGQISGYQHSADMCVIEPNRRSNNICRNVRYEGVERFQILCQNSAQVLEAHQNKVEKGAWGLMCILSNEFIKVRRKTLDLVDVYKTVSPDGIVLEVDGENEPTMHKVYSANNNQDSVQEESEIAVLQRTLTKGDEISCRNDESVMNKIDGMNIKQCARPKEEKINGNEHKVIDFGDVDRSFVGTNSRILFENDSESRNFEKSRTSIINKEKKVIKKNRRKFSRR